MANMGRTISNIERPRFLMIPITLFIVPTMFGIVRRMFFLVPSMLGIVGFMFGIVVTILFLIRSTFLVDTGMFSTGAALEGLGG